jgi:hypothetical protein
VEKPFYPDSGPAATEVSEFAKWGGPVSEVGVLGVDGSSGSSGQGSERSKYPATSVEKEDFFEPLTHAQRSFVAIDGTTDSALCAAGIGFDAARYGGKKRVRQGIGERVVVEQEMGNSMDTGGVIVELPYVIGFERDVLDLWVRCGENGVYRDDSEIMLRREVMLHESYREMAGGRHTFYPETKPPPSKVLDVSWDELAFGIWEALQKHYRRLTITTVIVADWYGDGPVS